MALIPPETWLVANFDRFPKITVSSCTPGYIATDLTKAFLGGKTAKEAGMKTPAEVIKRTMHDTSPKVVFSVFKNQCCFV